METTFIYVKIDSKINDDYYEISHQLKENSENLFTIFLGILLDAAIKKNNLMPIIFHSMQHPGTLAENINFKKFVIK